MQHSERRPAPSIHIKVSVGDRDWKQNWFAHDHSLFTLLLSGKRYRSNNKANNSQINTMISFLCVQVHLMTSNRILYCGSSSTVPTCSITVSATDHSSVAFTNCCCSTASFTASAALLTSARPWSSSSDCTAEEPQSDGHSTDQQDNGIWLSPDNFKETFAPYLQYCRGTAPTSWRSLWMKQ